MNKITIGILTFNHEKFIAKCLNSVLALKYDNLEIIVSDDCSKDSTYQIVQDIVANAQSSHHIIINRNEVNLGLAGNFNKTFYELATGDFLITLGGDDAIKEDYLETAVNYFESNSALMMLDFNASIIDETGKIIADAPKLDYDIFYCDINDYIDLKPIPSFAPGRMIRNNLVKGFEPISARCPTEDTVLVVRALMMGEFARLNKNVIFYRRHSKSISQSGNLAKLSNINIIAQYIRDLISALDSNLISDKMFGQLLERFNFELRRRVIQYGSRPPLIIKFKLKCLYYLAKWKIM